VAKPCRRSGLAIGPPDPSRKPNGKRDDLIRVNERVDDLDQVRWCVPQTIVNGTTIRTLVSLSSKTVITVFP
jgi:hypothetical protein